MQPWTTHLPSLGFRVVINNGMIAIIPSGHETYDLTEFTDLSSIHPGQGNQAQQKYQMI